MDCSSHMVLQLLGESVNANLGVESHVWMEHLDLFDFLLDIFRFSLDFLMIGYSSSSDEEDSSDSSVSSYELSSDSTSAAAPGCFLRIMGGNFACPFSKNLKVFGSKLCLWRWPEITQIIQEFYLICSECLRHDYSPLHDHKIIIALLIIAAIEEISFINTPSPPNLESMHEIKTDSANDFCNMLTKKTFRCVCDPSSSSLFHFPKNMPSTTASYI